MNFVITGHHAIRIAKRDGVTLSCYGWPVHPTQHSMAIQDAERIVADDADTIYCTVVPRGPMPEGFHVEDFFQDGKYLGPDEDGVEPRWQDAEVSP